MKFARALPVMLVAACATERKPEAMRSGAPPPPSAARESETQAKRAEPTPRGEATAPASTEPAVHDSSQAGVLLDQAAAALKASDFTTARAKLADAVGALLSRPEAERDDSWLKLADSAGRIAWETEDWRTARTVWEQQLQVYSRTLPPDHPTLQKTRLRVADALGFQGDLAGARALQEQVLEVFTRTLPSDHLDLQQARTRLASTLWTQGDSAAARDLYLQALEVYSRALPADHPDLQMLRMNLALTLQDQGDLPAARALYEQALEVDSRTLPPDDANLQLARMNYASVLLSQGEVVAARALYEQVLEVYSRTLPPDHSDLQRARGNLASTLYIEGDLVAARAGYEQVLELLSRTLPPDHPDLQTARMNLALALHDQGDLDAARALYERVLEVDSRTLPPDHPELQLVRMNLAGTLYGQGDLAGARALYEQVLDVYSRTLPPDHPDLHLARILLAAAIKAQGDLTAARPLEEEVLEFRSRTLPPDHPDLQFARRSLAVTLCRQIGTRPRNEAGIEEENERAKDRCASLVRAISESETRIARAAALSSSSREAEERCSSLQGYLSFCLYFALGNGVLDPDPGLARAAFVLSETTRASALVSARIARLSHSDEGYAGLRSEIRSANDDLARLAQAGSTPDDYDAVIARRDRAERDLVQRAGRSKEAVDLLASPDPGPLSERLSEGDAVVAYRRYTHWEARSGESTERSRESLCAFVLCKGAALRLVDLGAIDPIESAVKEWRERLGMPLERGIGPARTREHEQATREKGEILRRLVFDPLLPALGRSGHLIVALDDVLHSIPLDALPGEPEEGPAEKRTGSAIDASSPRASDRAGLLGDRYRIEERLSLTEISSTPQASKATTTLVALGGASFNSQPQPLSADESASLDADPGKPGQVVSMLRGGAWEKGFEPLTFTGLEAREISALFDEALGQDQRTAARSIVLEKRKASRAAVEEIAPKARFLHLATHGWFVPESVRSWSDPEARDREGKVIPRMSAVERVKGSSPMLLCGLALAGANLPADAIGRFPGLVTAEEISGWDLSSCELAVLSACDTNVGERRAGQGVASLQKALHMAGARTVITSLWKVPDEATKELMLDFYRRLWVEKKPKAKALWEAKKRIREAKDESGLPKYTTRDWAAWVLTGDPD